MNTTARFPRWPALLCGALLVVTTALVYRSALKGEFYLDDFQSIVHNRDIRQLSDWKRVLLSFPNVTRPVVSWTFALDYALWGNDPHPYHYLNIAIHCGCALLLFAFVRRSLLAARTQVLGEKDATLQAFFAAMVWTVHPLNTEAVTYIVQRHESLMGFFALLALYAVARGGEAGASKAWHSLAVVATLLGAGCKQTIAVVPLVALLYDRCFISGSFKAALRRAPYLYAGMLLAWVEIGVLLKMVPPEQKFSAGFGTAPWWPYARSQFVVITHYLRLVVFPVGQCFEYAWQPETDYLRIVPAAGFILALLALALWQLRKNTVAGFWAVWFFLFLAPTSTIMPIRDIAAERRIYLPLMGVLAWLSSKVGRPDWKPNSPLIAWRVLLTSLNFALIFGVATAKRNALYGDKVALWADVLDTAPNNANALTVVGTDSLDHGRRDKAQRFLERALRADPWCATAYASMGALKFAQGDFAGAEQDCRRAVELDPARDRAWNTLLEALEMQGKGAEAEVLLAAQVKRDAELFWVQIALGERAFKRGAFNDAVAAYRHALVLDPTKMTVRADLGSVLAAAGRFDDALVEFNALVAADPANSRALLNRGMVLERRREWAKALADYRAASAADAKNSQAYAAAAWLLATAPDDSVRDGPRAVASAINAIDANHGATPLLLDTLAAAKAENKDFGQAVKVLEDALAHVPANSPLAKELAAHLALFKEKKPLRTQ